MDGYGDCQVSVFQRFKIKTVLQNKTETNITMISNAPKSGDSIHIIVFFLLKIGILSPEFT